MDGFLSSDIVKKSVLGDATFSQDASPNTLSDWYARAGDRQRLPGDASSVIPGFGGHAAAQNFSNFKAAQKQAAVDREKARRETMEYIAGGYKKDFPAPASPQSAPVSVSAQPATQRRQDTGAIVTMGSGDVNTDNRTGARSSRRTSITSLGRSGGSGVNI